MEIMLSSFGLAQEIYWGSKGQKLNEDFNMIFYDAPPFLPTYHDFLMDITPFILYDKIIINKSLISGSKGLWNRLFTKSILQSENIGELIQKGIIEPRDYVSDTTNHLELLETITHSDLAQEGLWRRAVRDSNWQWLTYLDRTKDNLNKIKKLQPLTGQYPASSKRTKQYMRFSAHEIGRHHLPHEHYLPNHHSYMFRQGMHEVIQGYLLSINNNLLLSREYSAAVFDWFDYEPFYVTKLMLNTAEQPSVTSTILRGGTILSFYLPIERIASVQDLMRTRDKAKGLREYIEAKAMDDRGADEKILLKILLEIERAQRKVAYYQKISSYFTLPLSLIPLAGPFVEKITREVVDRQIEKKILNDYRWHFSLLDYASLQDNVSELAEKHSNVLAAEDYYASFDHIQQCESATKTGRRCRNIARPGMKYCWLHESQSE